MFKLIYLADNKLDDKEKVPTRADYVEKREIDRSDLYIFDGSLQLIHADVANLELLGKNARISRYVLLVLDLYSLKSICLYYAFKKTNSTKNEVIL